MLANTIRQAARPVGVRAFTHSAVRLAPSTVEPKTQANALINAIPGNSMLTKTGVVALGAGLFAVGISKELILIHPETIIVGCFGGIVYLLSQQLAPVIKGELESYIDNIRKAVNENREKEIASFHDEIQKLKDVELAVPLTKELFSMHKEIVLMNKTLAEYNVRKNTINSIKSKMDAIAALEAQQRASEQGELLGLLRSRVMTAIKDPKFQENYLKKCISDIESMTPAK